MTSNLQQGTAIVPSIQMKYNMFVKVLSAMHSTANFRMEQAQCTLHMETSPGIITTQKYIKWKSSNNSDTTHCSHSLFPSSMRALCMCSMCIHTPYTLLVPLTKEIVSRTYKGNKFITFSRRGQSHRSSTQTSKLNATVRQTQR